MGSNQSWYSNLNPWQRIGCFSPIPIQSRGKAADSLPTLLIGPSWSDTRSCDINNTFYMAVFGARGHPKGSFTTRYKKGREKARIDWLFFSGGSLRGGTRGDERMCEGNSFRRLGAVTKKGQSSMREEWGRRKRRREGVAMEDRREGWGQWRILYVKGRILKWEQFNTRASGGHVV